MANDIAAHAGQLMVKTSSCYNLMQVVDRKPENHLEWHYAQRSVENTFLLISYAYTEVPYIDQCSNNLGIKIHTMFY